MTLLQNITGEAAFWLRLLWFLRMTVTTHFFLLRLTHPPSEERQAALADATRTDHLHFVMKQMSKARGRLCLPKDDYISAFPLGSVM